MSEVYSSGTDAQRAKYEQLKARWDAVAEPQTAFGDCWMVLVSSNSTGATMWLGIEADGHCHS
jgi:hypothetical protein